MQTSGKAHEGWMTVIPMAVLIFIVVAIMGGPNAFLNTLSLWAADMISGITTWLKYL